MKQLPLAVDLPPRAELEEYLPGPNREAAAAVTAWADGRGDPFIYLFGPSGTGRTHLLQGACRAAAAHGRRALYLPLSHPGLEPTALEGLEGVDAVALDDLQAVADAPAWEHALFDLYNRLRETGRRLLVAADAPVADLALGLPDLRSRLGWGPGYRLRPLGDADCARLLRDAAARRGLTLGEDAVAYLMRRCPREPAPLLGVLDALDRLSLTEKRRPTVPLLRRVLDAHGRGA